jgi:nucleoside 2-deoxyribosyltransferase
MLVYLAGPAGFTEAGRLHHQQVVVPTVVAAGFGVLDPWAMQGPSGVSEGTPDSAQCLGALRTTNRQIGRRNAEMIRDCAALLAVLDGADVDSGTAAEIGYAAALARPVVGLRTDTRCSGDNAASVVNLQVEWFIEESGGVVATSLAEAVRELGRILGGPSTGPQTRVGS